MTETAATRTGPVALVEFVRVNALGLTRFAYLMTGDRVRAEDMVQDVFLAMHKRFGSVLDLENPVAYARRALVNAQVSWLRRRRPPEFLMDEPPDYVAPDVYAEPRDDVWSALARLPRKQRVVLVLRYYEGCGDTEIAALLGCRESTVRSLATRAFAHLRPVLRPTHASKGVPS